MRMTDSPNEQKASKRHLWSGTEFDIAYND